MSSSKSPFLILQKHNPFVFNILFWVCAFVGFLFLFSENNNPTKIDVIYTLSFLTTIIVPVNLNLYFLIPFFLKKERYILFLGFFSINILVFTQFNKWFFNSFIDLVFPDYYFISYHSNTKLILIFSGILAISTLLKLAEDWFYFNKQENKKLHLENSLIQTQLASLRAQINPHFLFNSLNVIYSLALKNNQKTTDAIIQLSDILRYVIYDTNTSKVPLEKEISLLRKYIEFQKYRYEHSINVTFEQNISEKKFSIYPMLLLPLLENSYKHGIDAKKPSIKIILSQKENEFSFFIENEFLSEKQLEKRESSGIGLKNIQQNLAFMYPKKHQFNIIKNNSKFRVSLKIIDND